MSYSVGGQSSVIIDIDLFNSTSPASGRHILCMCEKCFAYIYPHKRNITQNGSGEWCYHCSRGWRKWPSQKLTRNLQPKVGGVSPEGRAAQSRNFAGAKNPRWNPDRAAVERNARARKEINSVLWRTLYRVGRSKEHDSETILGYSAADLVAHLEAQFEPGMSWLNRSEWHIDHIMPVREFVRQGIDDPAIICALSNLRPLWRHENLSRAGQIYGRGRNTA